MPNLLIVGLGITVAGFTGSVMVRNMPLLVKGFNKTMKKLPIAETLMLPSSRHYKGGFKTKMDFHEAALILGVSRHAKPEKIKEAHKLIMLLNHPDRGGSPYLASKINEAKDLLKRR